VAESIFIPQSGAVGLTAGNTSSWDSGSLLKIAPRPGRKVAILGFGPTVRECPWRDESWELWGMNGFWRAAQPDFGIEAPEERYTCWFDMHTEGYTKAYGEAAGFGDRQEVWLRQDHAFPILTLENYPVEDVVRKLGREYFTSTIAYALAYALAVENVGEIGLWGIDLVHGTEWGDQRPCAEYWIGRAEAMGIKVTIHEQSALLKQRFRYGYEIENPLAKDLRGLLQEQAEGLSKAIVNHQAEIARVTGQMHTDNGALQVINALAARIEIWGRGGRV
jgi:hypothetical protein